MDRPTIEWCREHRRHEAIPACDPEPDYEDEISLDRLRNFQDGSREVITVRAFIEFDYEVGVLINTTEEAIEDVREWIHAHGNNAEEFEITAEVAPPRPVTGASWSFPSSEPGPEVTRVQCDCHGNRWKLVYAPPAGAWAPDIGAWVPEAEFIPWLRLIAEHTRLTDVSGTRT